MRPSLRPDNGKLPRKEMNPVTCREHSDLIAAMSELSPMRCIETNSPSPEHTDSEVHAYACARRVWCGVCSLCVVFCVCE